MDEETPDVVLVTIDALRRDEVGCYDPGGQSLTPNIDSLADDGVRFDQAISHGSATMHSFHALMRSILPSEFEDPTPTISTELGDSGYDTAAFVSNPFLSETHGRFDAGFGEFVNNDVKSPNPDNSLASDDEQSGVVEQLFDGLWSVSRRIARSHPSLYTAARTAHFMHRSARRELPYTEADVLVNQVEEFLESQEGESPVFVWTHLMEPHAPYIPSDSRLSGYSPLHHWRVARANTEVAKRMIHGVGGEINQSGHVETARQLYRDEIRRADDAVGNLVDYLRDTGRYDDTTIVVLADHGEEFLDHGLTGHSLHLYDELVRVPMIVKPPKGTSEVNEVDDLLGLADLAPTLLSLAGTDIPDEMRGIDFLDSLGTGKTDTEYVISQARYDEHKRNAVRTSEWKYIQDPVTGDEELYRLPEDPSERNDVSDGHSDVIAEFRELLDREVTNEEYVGVTDVGAEADDQTREQLESLGYL